MDTYQETIFKLKRFWAQRGCVVHEPWDCEVGAGTMAPETFLRVLGPKPYNVAYVQPSRRPADGRQRPRDGRHRMARLSAVFRMYRWVQIFSFIEAEAMGAE